jgi:hypothetical protein
VGCAGGGCAAGGVHVVCAGGVCSWGCAGGLLWLLRRVVW